MSKGLPPPPKPVPPLLEGLDLIVDVDVNVDGEEDVGNREDVGFEVEVEVMMVVLACEVEDFVSVA